MVVYGCGLEYYNEVEKFARENGVKEKFGEVMTYLINYACRYTDDNGEEKYDPLRNRCTLYRDFCPNSFTFVMEKRQEDGSYKAWMNGGVIYDERGKEWSVHT